MNLHEFRNRFLRNVEKRQQQQQSSVEISTFQATGKEQHNRPLDLSGRRSAMDNVAAGTRWLESVDSFANLVTSYYSELQSHGEHAIHHSDQAKESAGALVALIDDGVDLLDPSISGCVVGGKSFDYDGSRVKPFWGSEKGHGTIMARTILKACPKTKLYCIRIRTISSTSGEPPIDAKSVALVSILKIQ